MTDIFGREADIGNLVICNLKTGKEQDVSTNKFGVIVGEKEAYIGYKKSVCNLSSFYLVETPSQVELNLLNMLICEYKEYLIKENERKVLQKRAQKESASAKVKRKFKTGDLILNKNSRNFRSCATDFYLVINNCKAYNSSQGIGECKEGTAYLPIVVNNDDIDKLSNITNQERLIRLLFRYGDVSSLPDMLPLCGRKYYVSKSTPSEFCGEEEPVVITTNFELDINIEYVFSLKAVKNFGINSPKLFLSITE